MNFSLLVYSVYGFPGDTVYINLDSMEIMFSFNYYNNKPLGTVSYNEKHSSTFTRDYHPRDIFTNDYMYDFEINGSAGRIYKKNFATDEVVAESPSFESLGYVDYASCLYHNGYLYMASNKMWKFDASTLALVSSTNAPSLPERTDYRTDALATDGTYLYQKLEPEPSMLGIGYPFCYVLKWDLASLSMVARTADRPAEGALFQPQYTAIGGNEVFYYHSGDLYYPMVQLNGVGRVRTSDMSVSNMIMHTSSYGGTSYIYPQDIVIMSDGYMYQICNTQNEDGATLGRHLSRVNLGSGWTDYASLTEIENLDTEFLYSDGSYFYIFRTNRVTKITHSFQIVKELYLPRGNPGAIYPIYAEPDLPPNLQVTQIGTQKHGLSW